MHGFGRPHDFAAIGLPDRLMAETDAEDRNASGGCIDERQANAGPICTVIWSLRLTTASSPNSPR